MSDHTNKDLYTKPKYIHRHVGGKIPPVDKHNYINQQLNLINSAHSQLPPIPNFNLPLPPSITNFNGNRVNDAFKMKSTHFLNGNVNRADSRVQQNREFSRNPSNRFTNRLSNGVATGKGLYYRPESGRFDPYVGFLYERGLLDDGTNRRRYITTYIDINSIFRKTQPSSEEEEAFLLDTDPLDFNIGSNIIFVRHTGHNFEEGDLITMEGVVANQSIRRTFLDDGSPSFIIPAGCNVMKIFFTHGLPSTYTGEEIQVDFEGIRGDRGTIETSSFLGNIPTNIINSTYSVKLSVSPTELNDGCDLSDFPADFLDFGEDHFFVILPRTMHNPSSEPPYTLREYNYKIILQSIAGVPLSQLNAKYPITPDRRQGFHTITNVVNNGYSIVSNTLAVLDINGGGSCVYVARVTRVDTGYPNQNSYTIELGRTFHDIVSARLVSIEFPNSEHTIKVTENRTNNKMYWNDIDDGDFLYSIEVPPGNYTPDTLATVMEGLFFNTARVNSGEDIGATYTPNHFIQVAINTNTDVVTFKSFKEFILVEPIDAVVPEIAQDSALDSNPPDTEYVLTIRHPGHGMTTPGERILITGAIDHLGIPASIINTEHDVESIIDEDRYTIKLPRFNLSDARQDTKGGVAVTIFIPDLFRLRFDQNDTLGPILGFRNSGNPNSITAFSREITNNEPYEFDVETDVLGNPLDLTNNAIQLSGDNYIYMLAKPLNTLVGIGPVKEAFAKILLCDLPGKVLFNSHVNTSRFYDDPIHEISELEIEFLTQTGELFDFNGLDHSFTIEFITVHDIPSATHISANTGKNYNVKVNQ